MKAIQRLFLGWLLLGSLFLPGCSPEPASFEEQTPVEFTIVEEQKLPLELLQIIEENKEGEIRMTYEDGKELYLVRGYGKQKTGGYSICVVSCTENQTQICCDTRLIGPEHPEELPEEPSFPYLVVRIAAQKKEVQID